jgi:hypothetical protein
MFEILGTAEASGPGVEVMLEVSQRGLIHVFEADFKSGDSLKRVKANGAGYP